jgi:other hect domain ubiquitin protein ligase E3
MLYSKFLLQAKRLGITSVCGQIIGVDQRSSSVLVMHHDLASAQVFATWFPCSALKCVQVYTPFPASAYPPEEARDAYRSALELSIALQARKLLLKVTEFSPNDISPIDLVRINIES